MEGAKYQKMHYGWTEESRAGGEEPTFDNFYDRGLTKVMMMMMMMILLLLLLLLLLLIIIIIIIIIMWIIIVIMRHEGAGRRTGVRHAAGRLRVRELRLGVRPVG